MAHTVAGVVIKQHDRYLMVQEKREKCYGQWNWPAGWVDEGEAPEEAAIREAKEEVGLAVTISHEIGRWYDESAKRTRILYAAENVHGTVVIQESEILGAAWLSKEQMIALKDSMRVQDWTVDLVSKVDTSEVVHNKLVRDKIPDIVRADNAEPVVRVLDAMEYRRMLLEKLVEEAIELRDSDGDLGERADVAEVLRSLDGVLEYSADTIERARGEKAQARGGFAGRIFLEKVIFPEEKS